MKIEKYEIPEIWKRRAPTNDRYLSSQKCFNFCGVLIGGKNRWSIIDNWLSSPAIRRRNPGDAQADISEAFRPTGNGGVGAEPPLNTRPLGLVPTNGDRK